MRELPKGGGVSCESLARADDSGAQGTEEIGLDRPAAPVSLHVLTREYAGKHEMGSITPVCSCGWKGRAEYAYNDWQHTNLKEQESQHVRTFANPLPPKAE